MAAKQSGTPPDGGFGWVLVVLCGLGHSAIIGFEKNRTLYYQQLLSQYGQSAVATAWCLSLGSALRFGFSPFAGMLCERFGHRNVGIIGGMMTSLAFILSGFVTTLYWTYLTYSTLIAISECLVLVSRMSIVNIYFDKNKGKANAIVFVMGSVGGLYMAPLSTYLYDEYGFSGAMILFGGMTMHAIPPAILYRPLEIKNTTRNVREEGEPHQQEEVIKVSDDCPKKVLDSENQRASNSEHQRHEEVIINVAECTGTAVTTSIDHSDGTSETKAKHSLRHKLLYATGCDVLRNPQMIILGIFLASICYLHVMSATIIAGLCMEKGLTIGDVTIMLTASNAIEIVSRMASGVLFDLKYFRPRRALLLGVMGLGVGVTGTCLPLTEGIPITMTIYFTLQLFVGTVITQWSTVMSDIVPRSRITSGVGITRVFQGVGSLFGPLTAGFIKDHTGSYRLAYYITGSQMIVFSILLIVITVKIRIKEST